TFEMSSTSQDHGHHTCGLASTAWPVSEMESEFLEHASHEDSGQRNDNGTAGTRRRRIQLSSCFVCNVAFVAEKLDSLEDGVSWFQNLCKLLAVVPEQGEYLSETNPLCMKCCEVVEEFLYLQQQIEGLKKMISELSKMLGRRLVDKHTFTTTSRKNYQVKSKIYEVWIKRVNAPESQTFAVNIEERAPAINSRNEITVHSEQLAVPSSETDSDFALMNTLDSVSSANTLESNQNANCSNDANNQDCPSPVSVGFQDDDDEGMSDNDNIYVTNFNEETTDIQAENLESEITTAPSIIDEPNKPSSVSASPVCETDMSGGDSNRPATGGHELQPAKKETANRNVVTKRPAKGRKMHPCKFCGKIMPTNFALEMHVRTHTGERPFKCSICGKGCREKGSLQKHEKTHDDSRYEGEPKFECDICGKKYHIKSSLSIHRSDHENGFTRFKKMPKLSNGPPKPPRKPPVRKEKKYDENGNPIQMPKKPKPQNKKKLPKPPSDKPKVYRRRGRPPREGGPIICQQCGKPCKSEFLLKLHMQSHSDSRPFKCSKCQGAFKYKGDLQLGSTRILLIRIRSFLRFMRNLQQPQPKKFIQKRSTLISVESSSEEEFDTENEVEINTSIPASRSVRRTRGDSTKLTKSLQNEIEDNDTPTSSKVVRARTLAKKVSDAVTVQRSRKPRIQFAMKSSANTQGTQLTESYINEILGGKQLRLILTRVNLKVSVGRRSVSGPCGDATEPSNSKSVSDSITELQIRSIASKTDSITDTENAIVVEDEEYPLPGVKMEVHIEEEISQGISDKFEPVVPAASSLHRTTTHDALEPQQPTTSFQSQFPIIIHNPLLKNKTTAAPILFVPIRYDTKSPQENEGESEK
ncbi:Oocyte zinc finger protein XlCOF6, partial [Orchesella cincta]